MQAMTITLNGSPFEVSDGTTIETLLRARGLSSDKVAVELNRRLLKSEKYDTLLKPGDDVEVVTFVGGG